MKLLEIKKIAFLIFLVSMLAVLTGCGIVVVQDDYSLETIDGDITCEYRVGPDAQWSEECVDSDVKFDKEMFLMLFQEYRQYDTVTGSKNPLQCDYMKISIDEQPEAWRTIRESEFNVRAVFDEGQRNVSLYRYGGKLYFYVLSMGDRRSPELEGEYFIELPEKMRGYWQSIIEGVEVGI